MVARSWFPTFRRDRSRLPWFPSDRLRWKTMRWPSGWYSAATFFRSANSSFTNSGGRRRRNRDGSPISAVSVVSRAHSTGRSGTGAAWTVGAENSTRQVTHALIAERIFVEERPCFETVLPDVVQKAVRFGEDHARRLVVDVHRITHVKVLLCAGDGDVEQAALLLELIVGSHRIDGRELAVQRPDDEDAVPFEPFGGMDGGQDQPLVVPVLRLDVEHALVGRLQRQVRQEGLQLAVARGDRVEVLHVLDALGIVVVLLLEDRQVIPADSVHLLGRGHPTAAHFLQDAEQVLEALDAGTGALRTRLFQGLQPVRLLRQDGLDERLALLRPDALDQQQQPVPADRVVRVLDHAQVREDVFDVSRLIELDPASLHERDVPPREFDLQVERVEAGAEQDGDLPQGHAFLPQFQDALRDEPRLRVLVRRCDQHRRGALALTGEQRLGVLLRRLVDDLVGQREDRLRAAVVLLQLEDLRAGEQLGEVHDVAERRPAERVDALGVVPHHHHVVVREGGLADELGLQAIRVLVLVHHDVAVGVRDAPPDAFVRLQELAEAHQQIVVVHQQAFPLVGLKCAVELLQVFDLVREVRELPQHDVLHRQYLVHRVAEDLSDGVLAGKALRPVVQPMLRPQQIDRVLRIATVQNGEARLQPDRLAVPAEQQIRDRMEGAARDLSAAKANQRPTRWSISSAAFLVKVNNNIASGGMP